MCSENKSKSIIASMLLAGLVSLGGCATDPAIDTSPEAEVTFDGLHEIKGSRADKAWARPDADIAQYSKIKLVGAGITYRPGGDTRKTYSPRNISDHFDLTEDQKARLVALVSEEFREELGKSEQFTLVDDIGPDVLLIKGALIDVVSFVPPEPMSRVDIYLSRIGEATLVLEVSDSMTGTMLARAIDRRAAESSIGFTESSRVANRAEFRRLIGRWARTLRDRLDAFKEPPD